MNYKFIDENGREIRITDPALFNTMVENRRIRAETLLFDEYSSAWKQAGQTVEFQSAASRMWESRSDYGAAPTYGTSQAGGPIFGYAEPEQEESKEWLKAVSAIMVIGGIAMVMYTNLTSKLSLERIATRLAIVTAVSMLVAVVAFLLWQFAARKKKGVGFLIFAIGFLIVAVVQSTSTWREGKANRMAAQDISSTLSQMMSGGPVQSKDIDESKYGRMAPLVKFMNDYAKDLQDDLLSMNKQLEELKVETILGPEGIQDSEHISSGQARLVQMGEILDKFQTRVTDRANDIPNKVAASDLPEDTKREFLAGFNQTKDQGIQNMTEFFNIERDFVARASEMLDFMQSRQGRYKFVSGQVRFNFQSDANTFNAYVREISLTAQRENAWRQRVQASTQQQLDRLQRELKR